MDVKEVGLCGLKLVSSPHHVDGRGWFSETFNRQDFARAGLPSNWAQDNESCSRHGVLRGLHCQMRAPQGKLIRVLSGCIWDVAVDLRCKSPDLGRWFGMELKPHGESNDVEMLWIPEGFAHGFLVLSEQAQVLYKVTQPYDPGGEQTLIWNDPDVGIPWPLERLQGAAPILSAKDEAGLPLAKLCVL